MVRKFTVVVWDVVWVSTSNFGWIVGRAQLSIGPRVIIWCKKLIIYISLKKYFLHTLVRRSAASKMTTENLPESFSGLATARKMNNTYQTTKLYKKVFFSNMFLQNPTFFNLHLRKSPVLQNFFKYILISKKNIWNKKNGASFGWELNEILLQVHRLPFCATGWPKGCGWSDPPAKDCERLMI